MGIAEWKGEVDVVSLGEGAGGLILQAGRRQGTGSRSLGHEQRLSNTASRPGSP